MPDCDCFQRGGNKTAETVHHIAVVCPSEQYRASALIPLIQSYGAGRCDSFARVSTDCPLCSALVFTDTKADADKLGQELSETVSCAVLHGDVAQKGRERAMEAFRKVRTLSEPLNLDTSVDASA